MLRPLTLLLALLIACSPPPPEIELQPCELDFGESARCGWATVPEDWNDADGRSLRIHVVVLPARNGASSEPLLLFPGGPGQATTDLMGLARGVYGRVQETRDIVFIGQRGTGLSNALHCDLDIAGNPASAFLSRWDRQWIAGCHATAREQADLSHFTTGAYVNDIAYVMDGLGYERAMLWGGSGGTRTAAAVIRAYPERVVGAVLDGVTPIDYAMPAPFSRFVDTAWQRVVDDCAAQATCRTAFPDLSRDLDALLTLFEAGPVAVAVKDGRGASHVVRMDRGDLVYAIRGILYNAQATAHLPREVHTAAQTGDPSFFAQSLFDRSSTMLGGVIAVGLHLSVYCTEDVPLISEADVRDTDGTLLGRYLIDEYRAACEEWSVEPVEADWYRPFRSDVPVLLVSGHYDPTTPPASAESTRRFFPNSKHIVVRNVGHGAGFTCARGQVEEFLISASLQGVSEQPCPDEPILFIVEESG